MDYVQFQSYFGEFWVIRSSNIFLVDPFFDGKQLSRRKQKWYIHHISTWYRMFDSARNSPGIREYIANILYEPSYLGLERGLAFYGIIPEAVFQYTSVSSKKTQRFSTSVGEFSYQKIAPALMFWYDTIQIGIYLVNIWHLEKVLLDFLYLHDDVRSYDDFDEMRFNTYELQTKLNRERLFAYWQHYPKSVQRSIECLLQYIDRDV